MGISNERVQTLERLLADCALALEALLASPDLNLDSLEQATEEVIDVARKILQTVKTALTKSA